MNNGGLTSEGMVVSTGLGATLDTFEFGGDCAVEMYVKPTDIGGGNWSVLVMKNDTWPNHAITLGIATGSSSFQCYIASNDGGSSITITSDNTLWVNDQFIHIVVNISSNSNMTLYANGVLQSITTSGTAFTFLSTTRDDHYIASENGFPGTIAYLRFWQGYHLSQSEITDLYANVDENYDLITIAPDVSYSNPATETGALFSSPGDIVAWSDFINYVADLSLTEDSTARATAQSFNLNINENLVVNGTSSLNGNVAVGKDTSLSLIHI